MIFNAQNLIPRRVHELVIRHITDITPEDNGNNREEQKQISQFLHGSPLQTEEARPSGTHFLT